MEQTPPRAVKKANVTLAKISEYFSDGYIAYRYDDRNNVSYEHYCSVPIDGDTCTDCSPNSTVASTLSINSYTYPTSLYVGQTFSLKGAISSNYAISKVTVGVYTTTGTAKITASATPNAKSYNVSSLDAKITFNTLPAGTYVYKVIATDTKGTKTLVSRTFTVYVPDPASTLSINSYTYPTSLYIGQTFSLKGAISSNYTISKVTAGVYTTTGTAKITASATPNAKSYNISSLDAKITFNTLPAGTYVYKVIATDTKGTKTLVNKTFTIKEPTSTLSISSYTYPTSIGVGKTFSLKGAITSNYTISKVTVGVYTTTGTAKIIATANPNAKSYNVSRLDAKITFNTLPKGTYVYKVIATDTKGTKTLLNKTFTIK